jgi:CTP synthase (UTP-ammonia lyase)
MDRKIRVGIIGDYDPKKHFSHVPTNEALGHAAGALSVSVDFTWIPTPSLKGQSTETLKRFDALWCASGSPYESMDGAIQGIRFAREMGWPFIAT